MADRYLIRHSETQLHLSEGNSWESRHDAGLALTRLEVGKWLSLACEPGSIEIVSRALARAACARADCCAA